MNISTLKNIPSDRFRGGDKLEVMDLNDDDDLLYETFHRNDLKVDLRVNLFSYIADKDHDRYKFFAFTANDKNYIASLYSSYNYHKVDIGTDHDEIFTKVNLMLFDGIKHERLTQVKLCRDHSYVNMRFLSLGDDLESCKKMIAALSSISIDKICRFRVIKDNVITLSIPCQNVNTTQYSDSEVMMEDYRVLSDPTNRNRLERKLGSSTVVSIDTNTNSIMIGDVQ